MTPLIDYMSGINQTSLVILSRNDSGTKFAESIIRGADTFIIDPDKLIESIKENKDIMDRHAKMPPGNRRAPGILTHRDMFMLVDVPRPGYLVYMQALYTHKDAGRGVCLII